MPSYYDVFMAIPEYFCLQERRRALLARAEGLTLDIGAGTGVNLCCAPEHLDLHLVEPTEGMHKHIAPRLQRSGRAVTLVTAPAEALPYADASVDTVLSTLVLCTVRDPAASVAEFARVLKPSGRLLFMEHVLAESPVKSAIQRAVEPAWLLTSEGCHLTRDTLSTLQAAGFAIAELERGAICTSTFFPLITGVALPPPRK